MMGTTKLGLSSVQMAMRKRLMRRSVDFDLDTRKKTSDAESWRILDSTAADPSLGRGEELREIPIGKEGIEAIQMALRHWTADKAPGRPAKYDPDREGQEIFVYHAYGGKSIRAIAKEFHMGPATVQKLLNHVRFKAREEQDVVDDMSQVVGI